MLAGYTEAEINLDDAMKYAERRNDPIAILYCVKEKSSFFGKIVHHLS